MIEFKQLLLCPRSVPNAYTSFGHSSLWSKISPIIHGLQHTTNARNVKNNVNANRISSLLAIVLAEFRLSIEFVSAAWNFLQRRTWMTYVQKQACVWRQNYYEWEKDCRGGHEYHIWTIFHSVEGTAHFFETKCMSSPPYLVTQI